MVLGGMGSIYCGNSSNRISACSKQCLQSDWASAPFPVHEARQENGTSQLTGAWVDEELIQMTVSAPCIFLVGRAVSPLTGCLVRPDRNSLLKQSVKPSWLAICSDNQECCKVVQYQAFL